MAKSNPNPLKAYFTALTRLNRSEATEHTLRTPLQELLNALAAKANPPIEIIHEPRRDESGLGAPDFKIKRGEAIVGHLETKKVGEDLDVILTTDQIEKYKKLPGDLVVTNYVEWVRLHKGKVVDRESLCLPDDVGNRDAKFPKEGADLVAVLLDDFLSTPPTGLGSAKALADALAKRCRRLHKFLAAELQRQTQTNQEGRLIGLCDEIRELVFGKLSLAEFADAFAQTICYGLFLAKLNHEAGKTPVAGEGEITLQNAKSHISANFPLIRELVGFLDELGEDNYIGIEQVVEDVLTIINGLDLAALYEDISFAKTRTIPKEGEEALFARDPYVYFYEDFLKAYDKSTRKRRGVYYTPPPVVKFIVRAINDVLKKDFKKQDGLADSSVTVLDFATGTGTFLLEILQQMFEAEPDERMRKTLVREHVLKNFYGFEYLMAPYAVAHLKLSQFLRDSGCEMKRGERLRIYLTNTLDPSHSKATPLLLPALSSEVKGAQEIKDKEILVITGNPPYSGSSENNDNDWIAGLIDTYKKVGNEPLGERNSKWLQDDYVKFIRYAQSKMEEVDEGIVAIITNHSFLDALTFRGMRYSLMQTFNRIHVLDLHGSVKKWEKSPDGGVDENVFDIQTGVAISLFIKKPKLRRGIYHADLWGTRGAKHLALWDDSTPVRWKKVSASAPSYLFVPQDQALRAEYESGFSVMDIFPKTSTGIVTARDKVTIHHTEGEIEDVVNTFLSLPVDEVREKLKSGEDKPDWSVAAAWSDLRQSKGQFCPIAYRLFDKRHTYYTGVSSGFHCGPRREIMRNFLAGDNVGLCVGRAGQAVGEEGWNLVFCTEQITNFNLFRRGGAQVFPLYVYPGDKKSKVGALVAREDDQPYDTRTPNIAPAFSRAVSEKYGRRFTPEQMFGYVYAVLHSPAWREKFNSFLKREFPRIPLVDGAKEFNALSKLGAELVQAHLLKKKLPLCKSLSGRGGMLVEDVRYDPQGKRLYINKTRYFSPVSQAVWDFRIGGYQVLAQYLKSRPSRELLLSEMTNVRKTIAALHFTLEQMKKIDKALGIKLVSGET